MNLIHDLQELITENAEMGRYEDRVPRLRIDEFDYGYIGSITFDRSLQMKDFWRGYADNIEELLMDWGYDIIMRSQFVKGSFKEGRDKIVFFFREGQRSRVR